ncbi:unnamed protein product [Calypogeia fissa]
MKIKDFSAFAHLLLFLAAQAQVAVATNDSQAGDEVPHKEPNHPIIVFDKYSVSIASNISINVVILPEARELTSVPNGATIEPLGPTAVLFEATGVEINSSRMLPITFLVPMSTYMEIPITGAVAQTLMISHGTRIAVQGVTTSITRVLYGFSRQIFPQLSRVVISKISPDWSFPLIQVSSFDTPSLI